MGGRRRFVHRGIPVRPAAEAARSRAWAGGPSVAGAGGQQLPVEAVAHALAPTSEGGLGLRRLVAETAADNEASNAVLRSVGFVEFGREHAVDRRADGRWGDGLYWELLPAGAGD